MARVNFRINDDRLRMIEAAAEYRGVSRTELFLRSSEAAAIEVVIERHSVEVDQEAFAAFKGALDKSLESNGELSALLARIPVWEKSYEKSPRYRTPCVSRILFWS